MKFIKSYKLFERKDLYLNKHLNDLYEKLTKSFSNTYNGKNISIYNNEGTWIFPIGEMPTPFFLSFTTKVINAGFGSITTDGNKYPLLQLPFKKEKEILDFFWKREAKLTFYMAEEIIENNKTTIIHELTHYVDFLKKGSDLPKSVLLGGEEKEIIKKYYNSYQEINAYFMQTINYVIEEVNKNKSLLENLNRFKSYFVSFMGDSFTQLDDRNKKRILKRIYLLFEELNILK